MRLIGGLKSLTIEFHCPFCDQELSAVIPGGPTRPPVLVIDTTHTPTRCASCHLPIKVRGLLEVRGTGQAWRLDWTGIGKAVS